MKIRTCKFVIDGICEPYPTIHGIVVKGKFTHTVCNIPLEDDTYLTGDGIMAGFDKITTEMTAEMVPTNELIITCQECQKILDEKPHVLVEWP